MVVVGWLDREPQNMHHLSREITHHTTVDEIRRCGGNSLHKSGVPYSSNLVETNFAVQACSPKVTAKCSISRSQRGPQVA